MKVGDRVKHRNFGKGTISQLDVDGDGSGKILMFADSCTGYYCFERDLKPLISKVICSECGLDYPEDVLAHHKATAHKELENILITNDSLIKHKAEQYDKVLNMVFMSCGIITDGPSTQYIIDPSTVCDELLKIIITDTKVNRSAFVEAKKEFIYKEMNKEDIW